MGQVFKGMSTRSHFPSTGSEVLPPDIFSHPSGTTHQVVAVTEGTKAYRLYFSPGTFTIFWQIVCH